MDKKKMIISVVIFLCIMAAFSVVMFYDPVNKENGSDALEEKKIESSTKQEQESQEPTYDVGLTESQKRIAEQELAAKSAYYRTDGNGNIYEELWFYADKKAYAYNLWEDGIETRMVNGHYIRDDNELTYWIDNKEIKGVFEDGKLIIGNKVYQEMERE